MCIAREEGAVFPFLYLYSLGVYKRPACRVLEVNRLLLVLAAVEPEATHRL